VNESLGARARRCMSVARSQCTYIFRRLPQRLRCIDGMVRVPLVWAVVFGSVNCVTADTTLRFVRA
jgi:hypothetical protein